MRLVQFLPDPTRYHGRLDAPDEHRAELRQTPRHALRSTLPVRTFFALDTKDHWQSVRHPQINVSIGASVTSALTVTARYYAPALVGIGAVGGRAFVNAGRPPGAAWVLGRNTMVRIEPALTLRGLTWRARDSRRVVVVLAAVGGRRDQLRQRRTRDDHREPFHPHTPLRQLSGSKRLLTVRWPPSATTAARPGGWRPPSESSTAATCSLIPTRSPSGSRDRASARTSVARRPRADGRA